MKRSWWRGKPRSPERFAYRSAVRTMKYMENGFIPKCKITGGRCDYGGKPESVRDCGDCPTYQEKERQEAMKEMMVWP